MLYKQLPIIFSMSIYDDQAEKWAGDKPKHFSDFVGRPDLLRIARDIGTDKTLLDLGCGAGYFSRQVAPFARRVMSLVVFTTKFPEFLFQKAALHF